MVIVSDSVRSEMITRYRIKGRLDIRSQPLSNGRPDILGIAPIGRAVLMRTAKVEDLPRYSGSTFEEARSSLGRMLPVFIRHNDNHALNYDDLSIQTILRKSRD